jgi:hypothetical protein
MDEGQGERPFDPAMQARNQQEQVRASLERLCQRLAEWQTDDHADADDVTAVIRRRASTTGAPTRSGLRPTTPVGPGRPVRGRICLSPS